MITSLDGLTDRNGNPINEGDFLIVPYDNVLCRVVWCEEIKSYGARPLRDGVYDEVKHKDLPKKDKANLSKGVWLFNVKDCEVINSVMDRHD